MRGRICTPDFFPERTPALYCCDRTCRADQILRFKQELAFVVNTGRHADTALWYQRVAAAAAASHDGVDAGGKTPWAANSSGAGGSSGSRSSGSGGAAAGKAADEPNSGGDEGGSQGAAGFLAAALEGSTNSSRLDAKLAVRPFLALPLAKYCFDVAWGCLTGHSLHALKSGSRLLAAAAAGSRCLVLLLKPRLLLLQVWSTLWRPLLPAHWLRAVMAAGEAATLPAHCAARSKHLPLLGACCALHIRWPALPAADGRARAHVPSLPLLRTDVCSALQMLARW